MIRFLYWILAGVLVAAIVHIGVVLFLPRQEMNGMIAMAAAANGVNALTVDGPETESILGYQAGDSVYAFCPFDLGGGKLVLDALMPATLWSLTIYSQRGDSVYAVNSRQAGVDNFQISVRKADSLLAQITDDVESGGINDGWQVRTAEDSGLIVIWAAVAEPFQRAAIAKDLARSSCRIEKT